MNNLKDKIGGDQATSIRFLKAIIAFIRKSVIRSSARAATLKGVDMFEDSAPQREAMVESVDDLFILKKLHHALFDEYLTDLESLEEYCELDPTNTILGLEVVEPSIMQDLRDECFSVSGDVTHNVADGEEMASIVGMVSDKLFERLDFIVSVVVREIRMFYDKFIELNEDISVTSPDKVFQVNVITKPLIYDTDFIENLLGNHVQIGTPVNSVTKEQIDTILGEFPEDDFELISTGNIETDIMIASYLEENNVSRDDIVRWVKESTECTSLSHVYLTGETPTPTLDYFVKPLVVMLFFNKARALATTIEGIDEVVYSCNFWISAIQTAVRLYNSSIDMGDVIHVNTSSKDLFDIDFNDYSKIVKEGSEPQLKVRYVSIFGELLPKLSEHKINIDTIRGCIVDRDTKSFRDCSFDKIASNVDYYTSGWKYHVNEVYSNKRDHKVTNTKHELKHVAFNTRLKKEDVKEEHQHLIELKDEAHIVVAENIKSYIDSLNTSDNLLVIDVCTRIVAALRYSEYDAYEALKSRYTEATDDVILDELTLRRIALGILIGFVSGMFRVGVD